MELLKFMQRKRDCHDEGNGHGKAATLMVHLDREAREESTVRAASTGEEGPDAARPASNVVSKLRPSTDTELEIEERVYPDSIHRDRSTEVLYTAIIRNSRKVAAKNVALSLVNLPPWFKASKVMLDGEAMPALNEGLAALHIGDIAPGKSRWVVIAGTASP